MRALWKSRIVVGKALGELLFVELCAVLVLVGIEAGMGGEIDSPGETTRWVPMTLAVVNGTVIAAVAARLVVKALPGWRNILLPRHVLLIMAVVPTLFFSLRLAALWVLLHEVVEVFRWYRRERPGERALVDLQHRPARALVYSFLGVIAVGTLLLMFPVASSGAPVGALDALFTAVSAACVTGLVTLDTAVAWSPFGQAVILALVQLGGLGIMVISAAMALAFGYHLTPTYDANVRGVFDEPSVEELRQLLKNVVFWTLGIELVGALCLFLRFVNLMPWDEAIISAVFHAISAFCNAGFSLYSDSLTRFAEDGYVNLILVVLIFLGGLGFGVLMGLRRAALERSRKFLNIHVKLVLVASTVLLVGGALLYFFFEYDHSLAHLSLSGKMFASVLQSATTRTAGFNSVDLEQMSPVTTLFMIILMLIGASPGSTGGGVKTTTVVLIFLSVKAFLTERPNLEIMGRRIPPGMVLRAMALMGAATFAYVTGLAWLLFVEGGDFLRLAFEAASALGTTGLSMGVTPTLSAGGKLVVICLMFAGRIGPLTLVAAMGARHRRSPLIQLPEGRVLIG